MSILYYNKLRHACGACGLVERELWLVQVGIFLNYLGWGAVLPFEVIYLHDGRGFSLGVAGLVVGTLTGLAVVAAPVAGARDRPPRCARHGRRRRRGAGRRLRRPGVRARAPAGVRRRRLPPASATARCCRASRRCWPPSSRRELRHRATAVSRVAGNVGVGLGGALGGLVAAHGLNGFVVLFLANALTYVLYVAILIVVVREDAPPAAGRGRLPGRAPRPALRAAGADERGHDRGRLGRLHVGRAAVRPRGARRRHAPDRVPALANAITVVLAQIPVAKLAEGRRRAVDDGGRRADVRAACLLVVGADLVGLDYAYAALLVAAIAVGVGECFHTTVLMPLVADLAPAALRGRYMATIGLSWWLGLALAPTLGAQLLSVSPPAALLAAAGWRSPPGCPRWRWSESCRPRSA